MATVYVNSWSEFVSAIGVSGNTVVLPENAEWDMGEILPYGLSSNINIACKSINGRGTRIKNLNLNSYYFNYDGTDVKYFQNLLMTDWIGTNKFFNLRFGSQFTRCAISGITSNSVVIDNSNSYNYSICIMISCSVNVEGSHSQFHLIDSASELKYCRIELHGMNSDNSSPAGDCYYCELSLFFPNAETGYYGFPWSYYSGCILHGNMKSVSVCYEYSSSISIIPTAYDVDMFADSFVSTRPDLFIPCTDDQLKDPAYLRSKGFPIVVNGGG